MSYATIQTGWATVIKKVTGYDGDNVKEHDWRLLGAGKAFGVVLKPGPFSQQPAGTKSSTFIRWQTQIELYVLHDGQVTTTLTTVIAEREKLIDIVNKWPFLSATAGVLNATILSGGEIEQIEGTQFFRQVLIGEALEQVHVTRGE